MWFPSSKEKLYSNLNQFANLISQLLSFQHIQCDSKVILEIWAGFLNPKREKKKSTHTCSFVQTNVTVCTFDRPQTFGFLYLELPKIFVYIADIPHKPAAQGSGPFQLTSVFTFPYIWSMAFDSEFCKYFVLRTPCTEENKNSIRFY